MPDWRSDSKWAMDRLFSRRIWYKITSQEWVVSSSVVKESYSRSCWEPSKWPRKWCFIWAWLGPAVKQSSTADAWSFWMTYNEYVASVGIKQTLQQTCFTRKRKLRSKFWWLTRFCNSHDVSHFAAFFIVVGAKTSVAESVIIVLLFEMLLHNLYYKFNTYTLCGLFW